MLGLKIDVDTARGTEHGVPWLSQCLKERGIKGTFLFSLGPDHTGRAAFRVFRRGFFAKARRTNVLSIYGLRTLLNGLLLPGPHIGKKYESFMRQAQDDGHEVGIHCYDHIFWQDHLHKLKEAQVREEVNKAHKEFKRIFGCSAKVMGAAGWQANYASLKAYDDHDLLYASDVRGTEPFFPRVGHKVFKTLQLPTTLPTLDEVLGLFPFEDLIGHYMEGLSALDVMTIHAELEGMRYREWFLQFLEACQHPIVPLHVIAEKCLENRLSIPIKDLQQKEIEGRSGLLACG